MTEEIVPPEVLGECFALDHSANVHLLSHDEEKTQLCLDCNQAFEGKTFLKQHDCVENISEGAFTTNRKSKPKLHHSKAF